jgi:hypothetical protein
MDESFGLKRVIKFVNPRTYRNGESFTVVVDNEFSEGLEKMAHEVTKKHGQYVCQCGRVLAGCHCPEHKDLIMRVYSSCVVCQAADSRPLKDKMRIQEKEG